MNTIDILNLYQKIISAPPDIRFQYFDGSIKEGYSKKYIHDLITTWTSVQGKVEEEENLNSG